MRISVVIATLNGSAVLGRCLKSIEDQDYDDIEVVVADGGSRDGTVELLQERTETMAKKLVWFSEPDRGPVDAWNKAVPMASGDWIIFLGADDMLASNDIISRIIPVLAQALPDHRIVYGAAAMVTTDGRVVAIEYQKWDRELCRSLRLDFKVITFFFHKSLFKEHGPIDRSLRMMNDIDFVMRELKHTDPICLPDIITKMQIGGFSHRRDKAILGTYERMKIYNRYFGGISPVLCWWMVKAVGVYTLYRLFGNDRTIKIMNVYRKLVGNRPPLHY